jgi:hypothetical protein
MLISNSLVMSSASNKRVKQDTKDNIIHVHLHNQDFSALPEEKQGLIDHPHLKPSLKQEPPQHTVPSSGRLLQPIQRLPQLVNPVGVLLTLKPRWLPYIHFFLQHVVQEGTLHIHLVQLEHFSHEKG